MLKFIEQARLRAGVLLREHRERSKRNHKALPHGAAPMLWVNFLVFVAAAALLGSTWMLLVFIAGSVGHVDWTFDWRNGSDGVRRANWSAEANVHALIGVGLFLASASVAAFNAVWLHVRTHLTGIFRNVVTAIGALVALFMISGAIVVQQWGTDDRTRDEVAATQTAQAGVAALDSQIQGIETEMARLCAPNLTTYQAQACRSGVQAWQSRTQIAATQTDANSRAQFPFIQRAMADAQQGDRWRAQLVDLRARRAAAAVTTVQASVQSVQATGWFATFSHTLEDLRKPFIAVLGELLAMTMFGVALAALRSRQQLVETSGWADEGHRIEDLREEAPVTAQPMEPAKEKVFDAETGDELIQRRAHWARKPKRKGKPEKVELTPEIPPDETGVAQDGGARIATKGEHEPVSAASEKTHDPTRNDEQQSSLTSEGQLLADAVEPGGAVVLEANLGAVHPEISEEEALDAYMAAEQEELAAERGDEPENSTLASEDELHEPVDAEAAAAALPIEPASDSAESEADDDMQHDSPPRDAVSEPAEQPATSDEETQSADGADHLEQAHRELPETDPARLIAAE